MHIKIDILIYHLRLLYRLGEVDILYALRHINYLLNKNATDLILKNKYFKLPFVTKSTKILKDIPLWSIGSYPIDCVMFNLQKDIHLDLNVVCLKM